MTEERNITTGYDVTGKKYPRVLLILSVLIGGFMTVLTETLLNNGLPTIARNLHVTTATVQWLSTGYLLVIGIMVPVSALLLYRFDSKRLYLTALTIFLVGSLLAYIAPNFSLLLVGRLIQALSVGIIMPFMQNIMILIFPAEKRGMAMGLTGIVIALAPALGPTLSGWIVDQFSWRDLFGIMVPITIAVILLTMVGMRKLIVLTHPRIDILSIIESSVGFGALLYALATISGGHWFIIGVTLLIGIIGIVLFVRRQLAMDDPMLNLHVFQSPMFTLTTVLSSLSNMALLGMQLLVPLYLQSVFQILALTAGLVMIPGALMMAIVNPIAGMIFDRSGIEKMSLVGFTIFTLATIPFVIMTPTWSLITVTLLYAIWMAGISLIVMQLGTAGINALPSELVAHGNGVNTMARQIGASIGTALLITISTLGSQMSHATTTVASSLFGYHLAFLALVILSLLGLIGTFWLRKASRTTATVTA